MPIMVSTMSPNMCKLCPRSIHFPGGSPLGLADIEGVGPLVPSHSWFDVSGGRVQKACDPFWEGSGGFPNTVRAGGREQESFDPTFPRSAAWERRNPVRVLYALHWTRLSCHRFVANQVRLALFILSTCSGQAWRTTLGTCCAGYACPVRLSTGHYEASRSSSSRLGGG